MIRRRSLPCKHFEELSVFVTPQLLSNQDQHTYRVEVLNVKKDVCEIELRSTVLNPPVVFMHGVPPAPAPSWNAGVKQLAVKPVACDCPMDKVSKPSDVRIEIDGVRVLYPRAKNWLQSSDSMILEF